MHAEYIWIKFWMHTVKTWTVFSHAIETKNTVLNMNTKHVSDYLIRKLNNHNMALLHTLQQSAIDIMGQEFTKSSHLALATKYILIKPA